MGCVRLQEKGQYCWKGQDPITDWLLSRKAGKALQTVAWNNCSILLRSGSRERKWFEIFPMEAGTWLQTPLVIQNCRSAVILSWYRTDEMARILKHTTLTQQPSAGVMLQAMSHFAAASGDCQETPRTCSEFGEVRQWEGGSIVKNVSGVYENVNVPLMDIIFFFPAGQLCYSRELRYLQFQLWPGWKLFPLLLESVSCPRLREPGLMQGRLRAFNYWNSWLSAICE